MRYVQAGLTRLDGRLSEEMPDGSRFADAGHPYQALVLEPWLWDASDVAGAPAGAAVEP